MRTFRKPSIAVLLTCAIVAGITAASAAPASAGPEKFALVIGVARFSKASTPALPGSDGDAYDTRSFLLNNGWSQENVRTLVNSDATGPAILAGLQWLADRCGHSTSVCVFKYSGHVKLNSAADGDGEGRDENLWSYEGHFISDGVVADQLRKLKGIAWIDISGCEAAGFDDNVSSSNRVFTASSQEDEKSYESPAYKNSVWTELLVNQGLAQGKNLAEAFSSASLRAARETANQKSGPQHAYLAGGDASTWFNRQRPAPVRSSCLLGLICF